MHDDDGYDEHDEGEQRAPMPATYAKFCTSCGAPNSPRQKPPLLEQLQAYGLLPQHDAYGPIVSPSLQRSTSPPYGAPSAGGVVEFDGQAREDPIIGIGAGIALGLGFIWWCAAAAREKKQTPQRIDPWIAGVISGNA